LLFAVLVAFLLGAEDRIRKDLHGFTSAAFGQGVKKDNIILGMSWITSQAVSEDCVYKQPKGPTVWKG